MASKRLKFRCSTSYKKQCEMVYETVSDLEYEQKCNTQYEKQCHGYGYHQECEQVRYKSIWHFDNLAAR